MYQEHHLAVFFLQRCFLIFVFVIFVFACILESVMIVFHEATEFLFSNRLVDEPWFVKWRIFVLSIISQIKEFRGVIEVRRSVISVEFVCCQRTSCLIFFGIRLWFCLTLPTYSLVLAFLNILVQFNQDKSSKVKMGN